MRATASSVAPSSSFGDLLRFWREVRRISQLELGLEANVSSRHISFLETGRAQPSRDMVASLADVLEVPLRERNALLHAAGFAPMYRETSLDAPQMSQVRHALELILRQQEPFGAIVFDSGWDLLMVNDAYSRLAAMLFAGEREAPPAYTVLPPPRLNVMRLSFDPRGWRRHLANWEAIARKVLVGLHREVLRERNPAMRALLDEILAYPDVPASWREFQFESPRDLVLPIELRIGDKLARMFSTITTLSSPQDITLQELRIELLYPADEATRELIQAMTSSGA